ncbi:MAG: hypothetical protein HY761_11760 [Candidatus Omnitrophica bacterium]|nr:hypothetical protein [Candidatus Omnitrophota bacterium]
MSIIHDALKKVEQAQRNNIQELNIPEDRPKHAVRRNLLFVVLAVITGMFFLNFLLKYSPEKKIAKVVELPKVEEKINIPNQPVLKAPASQALVLNGVFLADNQWHALINNQIVKKGEVINGATLKSVSLQEVELENQGSIIKLSNQEK